MESDKMDELMDRYFSGSTSPEESRKARSYLKCKKQHQLDEEKAQCKQKSEQKKQRLLNIFFTMLVLAAIAYLIVAKSRQNKDQLGTFENPKQAFQETHKALNLLSTQVNMGLDSVSTPSK